MKRPQIVDDAAVWLSQRPPMGDDEASLKTMERFGITADQAAEAIGIVKLYRKMLADLRR